MDTNRTAESPTEARSPVDMLPRSKNSKISKDQTILHSTAFPSESGVNAKSWRVTKTAPENVSSPGKSRQNSGHECGEKAVEKEDFSQDEPGVESDTEYSNDGIHEKNSEARENEPVVAEPLREKRIRSKEGSSEAYPYKLEEEKWRKCMFLELEVRDPDHRKAISAALKTLRDTSQWRLGSLDKKVKLNEIAIASVRQRWSAKRRKSPVNEDESSRYVKTQPRIHKRLGILTSKASTSSASMATETTDTGRISTAAWVQSLETPPTASELDGWDDRPDKRTRACRAVTGVLRDFTKPFASATMPEEGALAMLTASASRAKPVEDDSDEQE